MIKHFQYQLQVLLCQKGTPGRDCDVVIIISWCLKSHYRKYNPNNNTILANLVLTWLSSWATSALIITSKAYIPASVFLCLACGFAWTMKCANFWIVWIGLRWLLWWRSFLRKHCSLVNITFYILSISKNSFLGWMPESIAEHAIISIVVGT